MIDWKRSIAAGLVCLSLGQPATAGTNRVTLFDANKAFAEAVLRIDSKPGDHLVRWTAPIYLAVGPGVTRQVEAAVRNYAAIAGVTVNLVSITDPRANFIVRVSPVGRCRAALEWDDVKMLRAEITITDDPRKLTRCINHETLHGFGFRSHAHFLPSVLSYQHATEDHATDVDRLMLATLYDPRMTPGMPIQEASATACRILAEKLGSSPQEVAGVCPL